jgi:hypothetical protein
MEDLVCEDVKETDWPDSFTTGRSPYVEQFSSISWREQRKYP